MKRLLFTLLILLNLIGYTQTADVVTGCAPLKVQFTAPTSSNTYYWDFKDGASSPKQNPSNLFLEPGVFNVEFREAVGGPVVGTVKVTILDRPKINFTLPQGCAPYSGTFVNTSVVDPAIVVSNYKWVFGDGQSFDGLTPPSHLFQGKGPYNVTLLLESSTMPSCADNASKTNPIQFLDPPVANIVSGPTLSCDDQASFTFSSGSTGVQPLTYSWVFGNGATSNVANPPAQSFTKGQYNNTLSVSYANMPSCKRDANVGVSVGRPDPKIIFSKDSICPGTRVKIRSNISSFANWDYSSDAEPVASVGEIDSVKFNTPGMHFIKLTINGNCPASVTDTLFVHPRVTAAIEPQPLYACERPLKVPFKAVSNQTGVRYEWSFSDTIRVDARTQTVDSIYTRKKDKNKYDINKADSIYARLTVISRNQCIAKDTVKDMFFMPTARMVADKWHGCYPLEVQFGGRISIDHDKNRINSLKWNFGDGTPSIVTTKKEDSLKHTFTAPGVYEVSVEVTTERGCKDTSYVIRIEVGDKLDNQIDFSADKSSVCSGDLVTFTVTRTSPNVDAYHFSTEKNRSFHCSNEKSLQWQYNYEFGDEDVSLEVDYNGCFSKLTKPKLINIKNAVAQIDYAMDCSKPYEYHFKSASKGATVVSWSFGDDSTSSDHNVLHKYNDTLSGNYIVRLTAQNTSGCKSSTDSKLVKVRHIKANIKLKDTLLCANSSYEFNSAGSRDAYEYCLRGYTWQFPDLKKTSFGMRPLTTEDTLSRFVFSDAQNQKKQRVWLIATDENNCRDTAEALFSVYAMDADFTASKDEICLPNTVEFVSKSKADTTIVSTVWLMGDGKKESGTNVSHLYNSDPIIKRQTDPNLYELVIIIKDTLGCSDSLTVKRIKKYAPTSYIDVSRALCLGDTAKFKAPHFGDSPLKFSWDFGNGLVSGQQSIPIVYAEAKPYNVKLIYEEIKSGCKDSTTTVVDLQSKPHANFTVHKNGATVNMTEFICAPAALEFLDSSQTAFPVSHFWSFSNGEAGPSKDYTINLDKGKKTVIHTVATSYGCADDTTLDFTLVRPLGTFTADKNAICKGETINFQIKDTADVSSYAWFINGKEFKNQGQIAYKFDFHPKNGATTTDVRLDIKGFNDKCYVYPTPVMPVRIYNVIADYQREDGIDTLVCFGSTYRFINKSSGHDTYKWDFGDGQTSTTDKNPIHKYVATGAYNVNLSVRSNALGCVDTLKKVAIVARNPEMKAVGDTICQGQGVSRLHIANPHDKSTYKWTPGADLDKDNGTAVISGVLHTTPYRVIETDSNGCQDDTTVYANIVEPIPLVDWADTIVIGDEVTLPAEKTNLHIFKWNPSGGLSCTNCSFPKARPLKDTVYNLNVTDVYGCFNTDVVYTIKVRPETFVKMPTIFTPNSDGHNDLVHVNGWGIKELVEFKIFNRWGQMLYSSTNLTEGWDGKFNGALQNSDVYVYKVKVKTWRDAEISQEGYINLVH